MVGSNNKYLTIGTDPRILRGRVALNAKQVSHKIMYDLLINYIDLHLIDIFFYQREWLGKSERDSIFLEPVSIPRSSSLIGNLSLELDFNKVPK